MRIFESGKDVMVRIPIIPGYNDDNENIKELRKYIEKTNTGTLKKICLLPYHKIGLSKYKRFNIPLRMDNVELPTKERMVQLKEYFSETGIKTKIGG